MVERSANCPGGTDELPDPTDGVARQRTRAHCTDGDLNVAKVRVASSNLVVRSKTKPLRCRGFVAFGAWWVTAGLPITPIILPIT